MLFSNISTDSGSRNKFFIWQTSTYNSGKFDLELEADIYRYALLPCTPQGDYVATVRTAADALRVIDSLAGLNTSQVVARLTSLNILVRNA